MTPAEKLHLQRLPDQLDRAMASKNEKAARLWTGKNLDKIIKLYCSELDPLEREVFIEMGKFHLANPFDREIYAMRFKKKDRSGKYTGEFYPAQIFLGYHLYLRRGQEQPDWDWHYSSAVCQKDDFRITDRVINHSYTLDRGSLVAAYCLLKKKHWEIPIPKLVRYTEVVRTTDIWQDNPFMMTEKVVTSRNIREHYEGIFSGTYSDAEEWTLEAADIPGESHEKDFQEDNPNIGTNLDLSPAPRKGNDVASPQEEPELAPIDEEPEEEVSGSVKQTEKNKQPSLF